MNRQERRRKEREKDPSHSQENLTEYLQQPNAVVRRGELLGVVDKLIRLHLLKRKRDRWWRKAQRWILRGQ